MDGSCPTSAIPAQYLTLFLQDTLTSIDIGTGIGAIAAVAFFDAIAAGSRSQVREQRTGDVRKCRPHPPGSYAPGDASSSVVCTGQYCPQRL